MDKEIILGQNVLDRSKEAQYDIGTVVDVKFTKKLLQNGNEANYIVVKVQLDNGVVVTEQMKISYQTKSKFYQFNEGLVQCGITNISLNQLVGMKFKFERVRNTFVRNGIEQTVFFRKPVEYIGKMQGTQQQVAPPQQTFQQTTQVQVPQPQTSQVYTPPTQTSQVYSPPVQQAPNKTLEDKIYEIVSKEPTYINDLANRLGVSVDEIRNVVTGNAKFKNLNDVIFT